MFARLGVSPKTIFEKIGKAMMLEGVEKGAGLDLNVHSYSMFFYAYEEALSLKRETVDVIELFLAIIHRDHWAQEIFFDLEMDDAVIRHSVEWVYIQRHLRDQREEWRRRAARKPKGIMDRAMTAQPSPLLQSLSQDYTAIASQGGFFPLIGRESEMDQVLRIMGQGTGNVILVGPSGVGKTTLFEGLAQVMASEDVPPTLQDKRFVVLDPGQLIAGASGMGALEQRMEEIIYEVVKAGNIILGIEDIHHLLNMRSSGGSEDVAGILMNAISQGFIRVIATTTTEEYQQFIQSRAPFIRRFQNVHVEELSRDGSILVLEAKSGQLEYKHRVFFSYAAIVSIVDLTTKFIPDRYLPSKALDVMTEVAGLVESRKGAGAFVTKDDVAQVISEKTNVEVGSLTESDRDKLLHLEDLLHERMVGQDEAVNAVAAALRRSREGLRDTHRPIASLLFLGPTGVGKTEMAKTIAEVYFGNEQNMIRLDMSEYQDMNSLRKLIGAKGDHGLLTEAIRQKPFALVLLDELEKAHPDVLNVFLQVMDDGRLTDGTGKTFDMSNTMIIATSNAGTQQMQNSYAAGLSSAQIKTTLLEEVLPQMFRPEFINRFDNVVVFTPLSFAEVVDVASHLIELLQKKLFTEKGIALEVMPEAVLQLAQMGYDPQYGARPLRRVIQDSVNDALAKLLLSQNISRRDTVILKAGGEIEIKKAVGL
jgi:ATP-dependent Clp protease ATP-binding subunit ClpC